MTIINTNSMVFTTTQKSRYQLFSTKTPIDSTGLDAERHDYQLLFPYFPNFSFRLTWLRLVDIIIIL